MLILNILTYVAAGIFIAASFMSLRRFRGAARGPTVRHEGETLADGSQGSTVTIGTWPSDDIDVSGCEGYFPDSGRFEIEAGAGGVTEKELKRAGIDVGGSVYRFIEELEFTAPVRKRTAKSGAALIVAPLLFTGLRAAAVFVRYGSVTVTVPFMIIAAYILTACAMRADRRPVVELSFAMLLTYYVDAALYGSAGDPAAVASYAGDAALGVALYTGFALAASLMLRIDFSRRVGRLTLHQWLRIAAGVVIIALIVLNVALARQINGAYNWITVFGVTFQPSEVVKALFVFVVILPFGTVLSGRRMVFEAAFVAVCFAYGYLIRDTGFLIQIGAVFLAAVIIQARNAAQVILLAALSVFGCALVATTSRTAASRISGWLADGKVTSLFEALSATGVTESPDNYGYQSMHALVAAFRNGAFAGNDGFDVLTGIEAANSDLVTSYLAQIYGYFILAVILALYLLMVFAVIQGVRSQNKLQQKLSCISMALIALAMVMNMAGTFGILPLTGVVSPALSDGMSSAVCYGALFGAVSASDAGYIRPYVLRGREGERTGARGAAAC